MGLDSPARGTRGQTQPISAGTRGRNNRAPVSSSTTTTKAPAKKKQTTTTTTKNTSGKPPKPPKAAAKKAKVKTEAMGANRTGNFKPHEDVWICQGYVNASTCPIVGCNQHGDAFWAKVGKNFNTLSTEWHKEQAEAKGEEVQITGVTRTFESLKNRWSRHISKETQYWNSHYKTVLEKKESGKSEEDLIVDANNLYVQFRGKPWRYGSCVTILHQLPKFNPKLNFGEEESDDDDPNAAGEDGLKRSHNTIGNPMGTNLPRPMGSKKAKALKKDSLSLASTDASNNHHLSMLATGSNRQAAVLSMGQRHQSMQKNAQLYLDLGLKEKAMEILAQVELECNAQQEEEAKWLNSKPPAVSNAPVKDVVVTQVTSPGSSHSGDTSKLLAGIANATGHPMTTNNKEAAKVVANASASTVGSVNTDSLDTLMTTTSSGHKLSEKEQEEVKERAKKELHEKRVGEKKKAVEEEMLQKALTESD